LSTTLFTDLGANYAGSLTTNLMEMGRGEGPGEVGNLEYVAFQRNSIALSDVCFLIDEDVASGNFTSIFAFEKNPPNRTQVTALGRLGHGLRGAGASVWRERCGGRPAGRLRDRGQ